MFSKVAVVAVACVVGSSIVSATTASAADLPVKAPYVPVNVVQNWTGWYLGGSVGYIDGQVTRGTPSFPATSALKPSGIVGTVLGGYDYQFANNIVLGGRVSVPIFSISSSTPSGTGVTFAAKSKGAVLFQGRAGYAIGNWLPFVIGGGVWARAEGQVVGIGVVDADHSGYVIGTGVEYRVTPSWSIEAAFTHVELSKEIYNFRPFGGLAVQQGFESNNFTLGANYRFGHGM
jgi:high affinity Mn2+ porin